MQAVEEEEAEGAETAEAAEAAEAEEPPPPKVKEKKLANQFNFIERSSRTLDNPLRVRCLLLFPSVIQRIFPWVGKWSMFVSYCVILVDAGRREKKKSTTVFQYGKTTFDDGNTFEVVKVVTKKFLP